MHAVKIGHVVKLFMLSMYSNNHHVSVLVASS